jgi:hypothetical protein
MRKCFIVAGCLLFLVGCVTTKSAMQSWIGRPESDLVTQWGAPHRSTDTRDGKRVLTWEKRWGECGQNTCRQSFTVDETGIIRQWSYDGCFP